MPWRNGGGVTHEIHAAPSTHDDHDFDWRASIAAGFNGSHFTQPPGETAWIPLPGDPQPPGMDHVPDDHDEDWES